MSNARRCAPTRTAPFPANSFLASNNSVCYLPTTATRLVNTPCHPQRDVPETLASSWCLSERPRDVVRSNDRPAHRPVDPSARTDMGNDTAHGDADRKARFAAGTRQGTAIAEVHWVDHVVQRKKRVRVHHPRGRRKGRIRTFLGDRGRWRQGHGRWAACRVRDVLRREGSVRVQSRPHLASKDRYRHGRPGAEAGHNQAGSVAESSTFTDSASRPSPKHTGRAPSTTPAPWSSTLCAVTTPTCPTT